LGSQNYMRISTVWRVRAPNHHVIQGSTVIANTVPQWLLRPSPVFLKSIPHTATRGIHSKCSLTMTLLGLKFLGHQLSME